MDFPHTGKLYAKADLSKQCRIEKYWYKWQFSQVYCIMPDRKKSPWANCVHQSEEMVPVSYMNKMYECNCDRIKDKLERENIDALPDLEGMI